MLLVLTLVLAWSGLQNPADPRMPSDAVLKTVARAAEHGLGRLSWTFLDLTLPPTLQARRAGLSFMTSTWGVWTDQDSLREAHAQLETFAWLHWKALRVRARGVLYHTFWNPPALPYYDPLLQPDFRLYTFDPQPVIGQRDLFDVRTDELTLAYQRPNLVVLTGKQRVRIGPGVRYNLILSGFSQPLSFLYFVRWRIRPFVFTVFHAWLPDTFPNRRFSFQRVEFHPTPWLILGLNEGVLYGPGSDPLKYINPVDLYYVTQRRGTTNLDNLVGMLDFTLRPRPGWLLYGTFFNDDFLVTTEEDWGTSLYAYQVGTWIQRGPYRLVLEHAFARRWTFFHLSRANSYLYWGLPLGLWTGSDVVTGYGELTYHWGPWRFAGSVEYLAHGDGPLGVSYENDTLKVPDIATPSGIVDRRVSAGVQVRYLSPRWTLVNEIRRTWIRNYGNRPGDDLARWEFRLYAGLLLGTPVEQPLGEPESPPFWHHWRRWWHRLWHRG